MIGKKVIVTNRGFECSGHPYITSHYGGKRFHVRSGDMHTVVEEIPHKNYGEVYVITNGEGYYTVITKRGVKAYLNPIQSNIKYHYEQRR